MSIEPLKEYFDNLSMFAISKYEIVNKDTKGVNIEKISALIEQGCLSGIDASTANEDEFFDVQITPHGAVVLAEWSLILERQSISGRLLLIAERFLWVLIGASVTLISQLIAK